MGVRPRRAREVLVATAPNAIRTPLVHEDDSEKPMAPATVAKVCRGTHGVMPSRLAARLLVGAGERDTGYGGVLATERSGRMAQFPGAATRPFVFTPIDFSRSRVRVQPGFP
jgi:hypothetical protein